MSDDDLAALEAEIDAEEEKVAISAAPRPAPSKKRPPPPPPSRRPPPSSTPPPPSDSADESLDDDFDDGYDRIDFKQLAALTAAPPHDDEADLEGVDPSLRIHDDAVDADMRALLRELRSERGDHLPVTDDDADDDLAHLDADADAEAEAKQPVPPPIPAVPPRPAGASPTSATRSAAERREADRETQRRMQAEAVPPPSFSPPASPSPEAVRGDVQRQLDAARSKALQFSRAGRKDEALEVMKSVKALQARLQQMDAAQAVQQSNPPPHASSSSSPDPSSDPLTALRARLTEYQRAALAHKQAGRLDRAKALVLEVRRIKALIEEAQSGQGKVLIAADVPPPLDPVTGIPRLSRQSSGSSLTKPPSAGSTSSPAPLPPPRPPSRPTSASPPALPARSPAHKAGGLTTKQSLQYATLLQQLTSQADDLQRQIASLLSAASSAASAPTPPSSSATPERTFKLLALQYHRLLKRTRADIALLQTAQSRAIPPPSTHSVEERLTAVHENDDVADDALLLLLHTGKDLTDAFYSVTLQWEGGGQTLTWNSSSVKGPQPEWKGRWLVSIGARTKVSVKAVARSRVVVVLYRQRLILGSAEVGRGELKLKDLAAHCDKREAVKLRDPEGRRVGEVAVEARLRRPLERMETREVVRSFLVIDEFDQDADAATGPRPSQPATTAAHSTAASSAAGGTSAERERTPSPSPAAGGGAGVRAVVAAPALPEGLTEEDVADPHAVLGIFSNDVLEWEIQQRVPLLLQMARQRGDQAAVEDLTDRLMSLQTQLQILVNGVQQGKLQLDDYLNKLREAIAKNTALAKALMQRGKKEDAKVVIQRVQLMKTEVKSAEDNAEELHG